LILAQAPDKFSGIEVGDLGMVLRREGRRKARDFPEVNEAWFQPHRAPGHMRCRDADRHDEVVDSPRKQAPVRDLARSHFFHEHKFAVVRIIRMHRPAKRGVMATGMTVHVPVNEGDAVIETPRETGGGIGGEILFGQNVAARDPACLPDVHLPRDVAVVRELVPTQPPVAHGSPLFIRPRVVVLEEPHQAQRELCVPFSDATPRRPVALRVVPVLAR
jgi:hypothetical protein